MSDYISKSKAVESLKKYKFGAICNDEEREYTKEMVLVILNGLPTVDEKEIIRKYGEQIIKKLEFESEWSEPTFDEDGFCNDDSWEMIWLDKAIEIVKEECGISE